MDQDLGVGTASVGLLPSDPPSLLLPPKLLPQGYTWSKSRPCWADRCGRTTWSPFFSSKAAMCSRQKPNLGCFGPKETFTTKLYTLENKWAFILEGNPARLFIICTTIIKLVLISIVECCWVGQLAGPVVWVGTTSSSRRCHGKQGHSLLLLELFSWDLSFALFCVCSLQLQSRPRFSFSLPLFSFFKILGAF